MHANKISITCLNKQQQQQQHSGKITVTASTVWNIAIKRQTSFLSFLCYNLVKFIQYISIKVGSIENRIWCLWLGDGNSEKHTSI